MSGPGSEQVWALADRLLRDIVEALRSVDELAPGFPEELYEARDQDQGGLQVVDYLERMARHGTQHHHELAAIRASIGASRPTDPSDEHPQTGAPYAARWYQWFLLDALIQRAALVGELVGLTDDDLDRAPDPTHTAGNTRTVRQVCEHVLQVQQWLSAGVRDGIESCRREGSTPASPTTS